MAFLQPAILLKTVLGSFGSRSSHYICRQVIKSNVLTNSNIRHYAVVRGQPARLDKKLQKMEKSAEKSQFVSKQEVNEFLRTVDEEKPTLLQYLQAFKFFGKFMSEETPETRAKLTRQLWESLENRYAIGIQHYNELLGVYIENEQSFSLEETLEDIESRNLHPNHLTYQRIIESYGRNGDLDGVEKVLAVMKERRLRLNEHIYNSLILAHGLGGQKEAALKIVETMQEEGFQPTRETYFNVLRVHAKYGDITIILSEIERLKSENVTMQDEDILQLVFDLAVNGHSANCERLFDLLIKGGRYTRLATNTINCLIQKNQDDVAYSLLKTFPTRTTTSGQNVNEGGFLLTQMMKENRSREELTAMCQKLQDDGLHSAPFGVIWSKPKGASRDETWALLRDHKAKSIALDEDNFKSLFDTADETEVVQTLRIMIQEFNVHPSIKFLRAVVMPKLIVKKPDATINALLSTSILPKHAALAVSYRCLQQNQLRDSADILNYFKVPIWIRLYQPVLISALKANNDVNGFVQFLRVHYEFFRQASDDFRKANMDSNEVENTSREEPDHSSRSDALGSIIFDTLTAIDPQQRVQTISGILKGLVDKGVTISAAQADRIQNEIGPAITADISKYLDQLASGELELQPIEKAKLRVATSSFRLEKKISENRTPNKVHTQVELLKAYHREGNVAKFEQLMDQLSDEKVSIPPEMYNHLIQRKLQQNDFTKATEIFDECKNRNPKFFLFNDIVIQAVSLFIDNGKFEEALQFLAKNKRTDDLQESHAAIQPCFQLLNRLAEDGKEAEVNQLFDSLRQNGQLIVSKQILSPLVKVHVANGDAKKAVEAFESLASRFNTTPYKGGLCTHLVNTGDWDALQKTIAISSGVHGEHNSLVDLAFTYIECDHVDKAQKLFNLPELIVGQTKMEDVANQYKAKGSIRCLESLLKATENVTKFKREPIFSNLLDLYIREDQVEKALNLNVQLQEQDETPSENFLIRLGTFLESKDIQVPFEVPNRIQNKTKIKKAEGSAKPAPKHVKANEVNGHSLKVGQNRESKPSPPSPLEKQFIEHLQRRDSAEIRNLYKELPESNLIAVTKMISNNKKDLFSLFNALAEDGDIVAVEKVNSLLPETDQNGPWYRNSHAKACGISGKANQWIDEWNEKIDQNHTTEELQALSSMFPVNGFYNLLENNPALFDQCEALANKYAEKNITSPMEAIWCHHVVHEHQEIAQNIWVKNIQNSERIFYLPITTKAYRENNAAIITELIANLKSSKAGRESLNDAYSTLLEIYVRKYQFEEALKIVEILKSRSAPFIRRTLAKIKNGLEAEGKNFPYKIAKQGNNTILKVEN